MTVVEKIVKGCEVQIANGDWDKVTRGENGSNTLICKNYGVVRSNTITSVKPPDFNWDTVKFGMCFENHNNEKCFYLCEASNEDCAFFLCAPDDLTAICIEKNNLRRCEKLDL